MTLDTDTRKDLEAELDEIGQKADPHITTKQRVHEIALVLADDGENVCDAVWTHRYDRALHRGLPRSF